nr:fimbria/pilus outer membrane usher protein [Edwardsiella hoshinae]
MSLGDWGAVSLDSTLSRGQKRHQATQTGQTWRVRYSKSFERTQTGFTLASYQYASSGYNSLSEVLDSYRSGEGRMRGMPGISGRVIRAPGMTIILPINGNHAPASP